MMLRDRCVTVTRDTRVSHNTLPLPDPTSPALTSFGLISGGGYVCMHRWVTNAHATDECMRGAAR